jgi:hypothetical protein
MRCTGGYKRVSSIFGGTVRRCRSFSGTKRKKRGGYRKRRGMATRGSHCTGGYKRVRSIFGGTVRRCKRFGGSGRRASSGRRGGYRKGRRPANKGRKCQQYGIGPSGRVKCMSFGGRRSGKGTVRAYGPQRQAAPAESVGSSWFNYTGGGIPMRIPGLGGLGGYGARSAYSSRRRGFVGR